MNQQSQPNQNKINKYLINNPIGQQKAQYYNKKILRNLCKFFYPFKQYYMKYPIQYIVKPSSTYIHKQQLKQKTYLTIAKQIQYFRGSSKHFLEEQYLSEMLVEDVKDRGLMENHQNKSLFYKGLFIYADGYHLKSIRLSIGDKNYNKNLGVWKIQYQFSQPILQIKQRLEFSIIVRCRYWIILFDIFNNSKIGQIRLKEQITSFKLFQNNQKILISSYDQKYYRLYQWILQQNQAILIKTCQSFWGISALVNLNVRQFAICMPNKIYIEDLRSQSKETLRRVTQIGNDRFISMIQVANRLNQIGLSRSQFIDIFDLRKPQISFYSTRHFCQEAPPSCLLSQVWKDPIIIAFSSSQLGSSILINLKEQKQSKFSNIFHKNTDFPILLYDSGKYYKGLYPKSITPIIQNNILRLIHVDSNNGISLQILQRKTNQTEISHLKTSAWARYPQDPSKKWIQQKILQPYLSKKPKLKDQLSSEDESDQQHLRETQIFKKNVNYCSLDKFRQRFHQLSEMPQVYQNCKYNTQIDTYTSTFQNTQPEQGWAQILKHIDNTAQSQCKISEQLLEYMNKDWRI